MGFPSSPVNGQTITVNDVTYTYSSATNSWKRIVVPISSPINANIIYANLYAYSSNNTSILTDVFSAVDGANASIVTANTSLKDYVDDQLLSANTYTISNAAALADSIQSANTYNITSLATTNAIVGAYYLWANANVAGLYSSIQGANAAIVTANTALKSYVDDQVTTISTAWQANAATQDSKITGANAAIVTANTALKSYVDDRDSVITTAWTANAATQDGKITGANAAIVTANTALKSYVDDQVTTISTAWQANAATQAGQIAGANAAIITANTALKAYTDTQTGLITTAWTANAATQQGLITTLQSQVYSNSNVDAHLSSTGGGNITISSGAFSLTATGPGATTVGGSTAIPVITTDAYGRIVALTSSAVSSTLPIAGTTGTGSVNLLNQTLTFTSTNGVVVSASGNTLAISTPQNLQTGASPTFAGITSTGAAQVNSTLGVTGVTSITNNTNSTGAGNGALVVTGGIGASGTVNFGSDLYVTGNIYTANLVATTTSTLNTSSPMAYFQVTPSYPYNFETGFYSHFVGGPANVYAHTGMVRNHNNNYWTFFSNVKSEPSTTTINFADSGILYDTLYAGGAIFANATPSTSTSTGALVVTGGAGINGNLNVNSAGYFGYNAAQTQLVNPSIVGTQSSQAIAAGQYYVQMALINNTGTGSADITAYPNNVSDGSSAFMDMGFTGNLFADPAYTITKANDGYLFASAKDGAGLGGNLVLATDKTGTYNDIVFATGSFFANAEVARFHGNTSNDGYLNLAYTTAASSTTSGALRVAGGVGIAGKLYIANTGDVSANIGSFYTYANATYSTIANASSLQNQITGANAAIVTANTALKSYVDDQTSSVTTAWTANAATQNNAILGANAAIVTANTALKSYVDTQDSAITTAWTANAATQQGLIATLQSQVYSNVNAAAYLSGTVSVGNLTTTSGVFWANGAPFGGAITSISSSGSGNITVSAPAGAVTLSLPATGPGATTVGGSTTIPVITTDAYGRVTALTSSSVSTTINLAGTSGTGSVAGGGTLTFAGSNGFTATASGSTITLGTPQNLQTSASPTFAGGTFTGNVTRSSRPLITNYTGNTAPSSPIQGDEWFRGNTGAIYKYIYDNVSNTYNWVNYSSALYNANTAAVANTLALRDTGGNLTATNFLGTASSAKYADLAEIYSSDKPYKPGTVVVFGGTKEVTTTTKTHDTRVAGVVSTNPAYLMNSEADGVPVAFTGRVPCYVRGPVTKGDVLVTSAHERYAERLDDALYRPGCVLGKALGDVAEYEFAIIEVVVGRF